MLDQPGLILDSLLALLALGFSIAVVWMVIAAGFKIGWKLAPYVLVIAFIAWIM